MKSPEIDQFWDLVTPLLDPLFDPFWKPREKGVSKGGTDLGQFGTPVLSTSLRIWGPKRGQEVVHFLTSDYVHVGTYPVSKMASFWVTKSGPKVDTKSHRWENTPSGVSGHLAPKRRYGTAPEPFRRPQMGQFRAQNGPLPKSLKLHFNPLAI